jgi:superfamily II DNA or RNA helicase
MDNTTPKHPGAVNWIGKFRNITAFEQFETYLEGLVDDNANTRKGEAFEVLSEWYTLYKHSRDVGTYWARLDQVPRQVLDRLNLDDNDDGTDSLSKNISNKYYAYQSKFRGREEGKRVFLAYSKVSNFLGQTENADIEQRILITNCDQLAKRIRVRERFHSIKGSDFDRLTPEDWANFSAWLEGAIQQREKLDPKPHQKEALAALLTELQRAHRTRCIMACGSGKTLIEHLLIEYWIEDRPIKNAVILVPTLGLQGQTVQKFREQTKLETYKFLGVGSDVTIVRNRTKTDPTITDKTDLDFPVTTDVEVIKAEWLKHLEFGYPLIVFCVYNSAATLGEALKECGGSFEIGIFDEAHKTVGQLESFWADGLQNEKLPIKKRVFFTASQIIDKSENSASMDDESLYGRQVVSLSTSNAIKEGLCCDFEILVSTIDEESDLTYEELLGSDVMHNGQRLTGGLTAQQRAIRDAVEQFNIKKVFAFDAAVHRAEEFIQPVKEGESCFLSGFEGYYIAGYEHSFRERERILKFFSLDDKALVASVRTMIEGIDAPDAELCVFNCRKKSKSDIPQMIGRVLRTAPGVTDGIDSTEGRLEAIAKSVKPRAYVLLPILVQMNRGESLDEALERADFMEVRNLANALRSEDPDQNIVEFIVSRLRFVSKPWGARRLENGAEREDAPLLEAKKIEAIKARIIDELTDSFERSYNLLIAFYGEQKNWDIPHGKHNEESGWLWNRAHYMRHANANGLLNSEKNKRFKDGLTARNFAWGLTRAERHVDEILDFQARNKRWPTNSEYPYMKILRAVATGRESSEDITEELLDKLRCKGWSPGENPQALAIDQIIKRLEDHYEQTKSWDLSANKALGIEATYMRSLYSGKRKSKYWNQSHVDRLNAKKFPWVWSRIRAKAHAKGEKVSEYLTATGETRIVTVRKGGGNIDVLEERLECDCGNREVWMTPSKAKRAKSCSRKCPIEQAGMRARVKQTATLWASGHRHQYLTATEETRTRLTNRGRTVLEQKFFCDCGGEGWFQPSSLKDRTGCSPGCSYAKAIVAKARTEAAAIRRAARATVAVTK